MGPSAIGLTLIAIADPLQWTAPPECPDAAWISARVEALTEDGLGSEVELVGVIESVAEGYELQGSLRTATGHSRRTLTSDDCTLLAEAFALEAALLIDPDVALLRLAETWLDAPEAPAELPPAELPAPPPSQPEAAPAIDHDPPRPKRGFHVHAAAALGIAVLRDIDGGLEASVGWGGARLFGELGISAWPSARIEFGNFEGQSASARLSMVAGLSNLCHRSSLARFEFGGCLGADFGATAARPSGLADARVQRSASVRGRVGARLGVRLSPRSRPSHWALIFDGLVVVPFVRPGFSAGNVGEIWRMPPVGGQLALGIEWRAW